MYPYIIVVDLVVLLIVSFIVYVMLLVNLVSGNASMVLGLSSTSIGLWTFSIDDFLYHLIVSKIFFLWNVTARQ